MAIGPSLSFLLILIFSGRQAPEPRQSHGALLDFRPVLANRRALAYILAYGAHAWELFAVRSWLVAFLVFAQSLQAPGTLGADWSATMIAGILIMLGLPASVLGNEISGRFGRRGTVIVVMTLSALLACVIGFAGSLSFPLLLVIMVIYACTVTGESASVTSGAVTNAFKGQRGATMAVHSFVGFAGASAGPVIFGWVLGSAGGPEVTTAWGFAFMSAGVIVALGALLVWRIGPRGADITGP